MLEYLMVFCTAAVLCLLSVQSCKALLELIHRAEVDDVLDNAVLALETRKHVTQNLSSALHIAASDTNGTLQGGEIAERLPDISSTKDTRLFISYNGTCEAEANDMYCPKESVCCPMTLVQAYHCKSSAGRLWVKWNNGDVQETAFIPPSC